MCKNERIRNPIIEDIISPKEVQDIIWTYGTYKSYSEEEKSSFLEKVTQAAEDGDGIICNQLGAMYAEGRLVEKDPVKAFEWYTKSSDFGYPEGISNLAFCYFYGIGTEQDYEKAYIYFSEADAFGEFEAKTRLGDLYRYGHFVEKNDFKAYRFYKIAFEYAKRSLNNLEAYQIYSDSAYRLGDCFYEGIGVNVDIMMAYHLYSEAYYYYMIRNKMDDSYCQAGLEKSREKVLKVLSELGED